MLGLLLTPRIVLIHVCHGKLVINSPDNVSDQIFNYILFHVAKYYLNGILISNVKNLSFDVINNQSAVFLCKQAGFLAFNDCINIKLKNVVSKKCGSVLRSIMSFTALPVKIKLHHPQLCVTTALQCI